MSRQINQPINQVRLTNVAVVRMNKGGKRFEIACYRNKVMDYRQGLETDLSEVLQTDRIFANVSKGEFAKHADLQKVFGTKNEESIAQTILTKGALQVSDLERQAQLENTLAQIATWVASHCVHPTSQRPYTISQVKYALGKQYQVQPHKPIKKQYLDCVKFLKTKIPIERAKMELALSYSTTTPEAQEQLEKLIADHESLSLTQQTSNSDNELTRCVLLADPSLYRLLDDLAKTLPEGKLEILRQVVTLEGDVDLEMEIERKNQLQQQQQQQQQSSNKKEEDSSEEDTAAAILTQQMARKATIQDDDDDSNDSQEETAPPNDDDGDDDDEIMVVPVNSRKQKKKQNKKAKRRQQQQQQSSNAQDDDSSEEEDADAQVAPKATIENDSDDDESQEEAPPPNDDDENLVIAANRKQQQQQQSKQNKKLSKKAKRRLREEQAERDAQKQAEQQRQAERNKLQPIVQANAAVAAESATTGAVKSCNTCGGSFPNAAAYRAHFKSDWHRFNQKLKMAGRPPVSEREFTLCDAESFFGAS
ncbi:maturation protein SBDS [Seminavis robusta]|uniref:Maturation protein SBDS n=1 Tax=Seminavis robusta TaxID=568900 RepID=A0A9N8E7L5_9STRA|nr:maturation protein SBDS [Seminavis robusta]|eukprot:Sro708_g190690.1 maturation protein SBDS (535) ;mRNA; r:14812-16416